MRAWLIRVIGVLRLSRVSTAFAAVANTWFVVLWTLAAEPDTAPAVYRDNPRWLLLAGAAVAGAGLYAFGACLNDVVDASRDRALRRDKPITQGEIGAEAAAVIVGLSLAVAMLGASVFGTSGVVLAALVALALLVFNVMGQHVPAIGMLTLGLVFAAHMLVPNLRLRFLWPVWLVMTHALVVAWLAQAVGRRRPALSRRAIGFALLGWAAASGVLLSAGQRRSAIPTMPERSWWPAWVSPWTGVAPALLLVLFAVVVLRRVRAIGPGPRAAEKITRYGSMWLSLYACAWLYGVGALTEAALMTGLAALGLIGMVVLREGYAMLEHPAGYRRG